MSCSHIVYAMLLKAKFFATGRMCGRKTYKKNLFFVVILKANDEKIRIRNPVYGSKDPDLDPPHNVTDPEHCPFLLAICVKSFIFMQGFGML
jgi:hypothetical protein